MTYKTKLTKTKFIVKMSRKFVCVRDYFCTKNPTGANTAFFCDFVLPDAQV